MSTSFVIAETKMGKSLLSLISGYLVKSITEGVSTNSKVTFLKNSSRYSVLSLNFREKCGVVPR